MARRIVKGIYWGETLIAQCPFCKRLVDEHELGCAHLVRGEARNGVRFEFKD